MHLAASEAIIWTMTDDKVKRRLTTSCALMSTDILASWKQTKRERWGGYAATALPLQDWWSAMTGGAGRPLEVEALRGRVAERPSVADA